MYFLPKKAGIFSFDRHGHHEYRHTNILKSFFLVFVGVWHVFSLIVTEGDAGVGLPNHLVLWRGLN